MRCPITNTSTGGVYTTKLSLGVGDNCGLDVILDTGSPIFAVDGNFFDPARDAIPSTTMIGQQISYSGSKLLGVDSATTSGISSHGEKPGKDSVAKRQPLSWRSVIDTHPSSPEAFYFLRTDLSPRSGEVPLNRWIDIKVPVF